MLIHMHMKKTLIVCGVIILLMLAVFAAKKFTSSSEYVVKIGNIPIMLSKLPLVIAQEKGFFKDAGITVQISEMASSNLISDALMRGDIDITPEISILPFLTAEITDPGKAMIFSVTDLNINDAPFDSIIVKEGSKINTLNDLQGKKIGVFPGTTAINILKMLFKQNNIDTSAMQFVQLPAAAQLTALQSGSIDALHAYEPALSVALVDNKMKKIYGAVYADIINHSPIGSGLVNTQFVQNHPDEAKKIIKAIGRAYEYMRTNEAESREIAKRLFKYSDAVSAVVSLPRFNYSTKIDTQIVSEMVDIFVLGGEISKKPDLANAYYQ